MAVLVALALFLDGTSLREAALYAAAHPLALISALLAYTGAFALRTCSWRPLIGRDVPVVRLFSLILAALFLNHAAPAKAGDVARIFGAARLGVPGGRAAASVVLARLVDLVSLLVVLAGAWALAGGARWTAILVPALIVMSVAFAIWWTARTKIELTGWLGRFGEPLD
ncbi:MAG: lysylphosphatidylglycerol synthase domain-containing protein, partial [Gemmataceae bacterium]